MSDNSIKNLLNSAPKSSLLPNKFKNNRNSKKSIRSLSRSQIIDKDN